MAKRMVATIALALALCVGLACPIAAQAAAPEGTDAAPCGSGKVMQAQPCLSAAAKKPTKAQLKAFKKASADFALELFARSVKAGGKNDNVTIAPLSIENALALTANGASGKTLAQMRKVLGDGASMARINKNLAWYAGKLVNTKRATIRSANSIWYRDDGTIAMKARFLAAAKKYYAAEVRAADFSDIKTVEDINNWVAEKTNGMITQIIQQLERDDRIVLLNALYFDAKWKVPFDPFATHTATFTNAAGQKRSVKMMHGTEGRYVKGKNVKGFIKPYAKGYSYVALLPKKGMSLKKYVASLDGDSFRKLVSSAKSANVVVAMPKYSLEYTDGRMGAKLAAMGMKRAFSPAGAGFSNMANVSSGKLYIGDVVHKTRIDVDEEGTKAAAVTAVIMKSSSALMQDVKRVTLNRPFVYAIIDNSAKLPVFIGTVNDIK